MGVRKLLKKFRRTPTKEPAERTDPTVPSHLGIGSSGSAEPPRPQSQLGIRSPEPTTLPPTLPKGKPDGEKSRW